MEELNLGRVASDFFASVLLVAESGDSRTVDPARLRGVILTQLDRVTNHPLARHLEAEEVDHIRFGLVAWADEMLLKSSWSGRDSWANELLQTKLFRTNRGGDEFYTRLERLRPDQNAGRLIYFLCLAFGFEGQLVGQEAQLQATVHQHYDMLRASGAARDSIHMGQLAPEAYNVEVNIEPPSTRSFAMILLRWSSIAGAIFIVLWGVLTFMASRVPQPPGN